MRAVGAEKAEAAPSRRGRASSEGVAGAANTAASRMMNLFIRQLATHGRVVRSGMVGRREHVNRGRYETERICDGLAVARDETDSTQQARAWVMMV